MSAGARGKKNPKNNAQTQLSKKLLTYNTVTLNARPWDTSLGPTPLQFTAAALIWIPPNQRRLLSWFRKTTFWISEHRKGGDTYPAHGIYSLDSMSDSLPLVQLRSGLRPMSPQFVQPLRRGASIPKNRCAMIPREYPPLLNRRRGYCA
jgi:hypothetical protein